MNGPGLKVLILGKDAEGPPVDTVLAALVPVALAASYDRSGPFVWVLFFMTQTSIGSSARP